MIKILAIIPARGGSKGVPNKNIKLLAGQPLLAYTAGAALSSSLLAKTIISTDSDEIADAAKKYGIGVPFMRPAHLAQDTTPTLPVLQHAIHFFAQKGELFDAVCILQATSPFRRRNLVDDAIREFLRTGADCLMSVLPVPHEHNPHWTFEKTEDGLLRIATGEKEIIKRRQDLPPAFFRDGAVYISKTNVIMEQNTIYGNSIAAIENVPQYHVNIDTLSDWEQAEKIAASYVASLSIKQ